MLVCYVFFDDILIYSPTLPDHVNHLSKFFSFLAKEHYFLNIQMFVYSIAN